MSKKHITAIVFLFLASMLFGGVVNENAPVNVWFCSFDANKEMITLVIVEKDLFQKETQTLWSYCLDLIKKDAVSQHREVIYIAVKDTKNTPLGLWKIQSRLAQK